jgi:hypothetical protein
VDLRPVAILRPLIPESPEALAPFYILSDPFRRPKPPVRAGLSSRVLSLCFGAGWVWPKLGFNLGYPPCYPSPVLIASSSASSPRSSSLRALSAIRCGCARGRATLVLARNCSSALVALGSPRSHPCGCSSAAVGLIIPSSSRSL